MSTKNIKIKHRVDTTENWEKNNPILLDREIGYEKETGNFKIGDGIKNYNQLSYYHNIQNGIKPNSLQALNAQAISEGAVALGKNSIAGSKCFNITAFNDTNKSYTLDSVEGLTVGDIFSLKLFNNYENIGKIINIKDNVILVDNYHTDEESNVKYFRVPAKPTCGTTDFGTAAFAEGENCKAIAPNSHASGLGTITNGICAHTEGRETTANYASHAEGGWTNANGQYAHTEGNSTEANANFAHAEGYQSKVTELGPMGHAEGNKTIVSAQGAHAEGGETTASGLYSHAEGDGAAATGYASHAEGYQTQAINTYAHAEGKETKASGYTSHAEGYGTIASGTHAHTEGSNTTSSGIGAHSEGYYSKAINDYAHAEGKETIASGEAAHSEGWQATASGAYSHAEGYSSATKQYAHSEGYYSKAIGDFAHAENSNTTALGKASHAEGHNTQANGEYSHAEGSKVVVDGNNSHGEGIDCQAIGDCSHAEGGGCKSIGTYSHAEGWGSQSSGIASHAEGYSTTSADYSHVEGYNNIIGEKAYRIISYDQYSHKIEINSTKDLSNGLIINHIFGTVWREAGRQGQNIIYEAQDVDITDEIQIVSILNTKYFTVSAAPILLESSDYIGKLYFSIKNDPTLGDTLFNKGKYSHVGGLGNYSKEDCQYIIGQYAKNYSDVSFALGGGTNANNRENLFVIEKSGETFFKKAPYISSDSVMMPNLRLATLGQVNEKIESAKNTRYIFQNKEFKYNEETLVGNINLTGNSKLLSLYYSCIETQKGFYPETIVLELDTYNTIFSVITSGLSSQRADYQIKIDSSGNVYTKNISYDSPKTFSFDIIVANNEQVIIK